MPQATTIATSWLRVEGPRDAQACAWCARWIGRVLPVEMQADFAAFHQEHAGSRPCRCTLAPAELAPDPVDPGCAWA